MQLGPGKVTRKENASRLFDNFDDSLLGRNGDGADMFKACLGGPGVQQFFDYFRYLDMLAATVDLYMVAEGADCLGINGGGNIFCHGSIRVL